MNYTEPIVGKINANTTPLVINAIAFPVPGTLWVRPNSGNTLTVEYSTDNGANWIPVAELTGATSYREAYVKAGFTHLRITASGTQGGTWGIC